MIILEKARWRAHCRAYRAGLSEGRYRALSARIVAHLLHLPEWTSASVVALYRPLRDRREVDIGPLFSEAWAQGKTVLVPVIEAEGLRWAAVNPETRWRPGPYSIEEPESSSAPPSAPELIVVPALGADRRGYRIGYGRGYYDRLLAGEVGFTVAPVYAACVTDRLQAEAHDVPVRALVTEEGVWRP
jgi:5-formyltetrahydrofolate cyclo-ligase